MSVRVTTMNTLEPTMIPGDLVGMTNQLNIVAAKGLEFAVMENERGNKIAIRWENITVMEEVDDDDTFIGR